MQRYMIESPHDAENCDKAVQDFHAAGYLHHFEWGCKAGEHAAWALVEAESPEHARQIVPWELRDRARIVPLVKFEVADEAHHPKKT
jgi:hypothetical protein